MVKIIEPVLLNLSQGQLKAKMPVVFFGDDRTEYAHLEAFGRVACGVAPWIELQSLTGEEELLRAHYEELFLKSLDFATDETSPDYMNFEKGSQPLVDAAFLSHALLRAPTQIVKKLDGRVKANIIKALKKTKKIIPSFNNWVLFSAMVEAGLFILGDNDYDAVRIAAAVRQVMQWYKGDGVYGDGADFHADYYNSFVIQPMLLDLVRTFADKYFYYNEILDDVEKNAQRFAGFLEKMISPEGTYPIIGRSITYRFGAFQILSQAALQHFLGDKLPPPQVRCALTAVIERTMRSNGNFDENGWLRHGISGFQPEFAEGYICTGSLYLCSCVFLALGLSPQDEFWQAENAIWSSKQVFGI